MGEIAALLEGLNRRKYQVLFLILCASLVMNIVMLLTGKQASSTSIRTASIKTANSTLNLSFERTGPNTAEILFRNTSDGPIYLYQASDLEYSGVLGISIKNLVTSESDTRWLASDPVPPPPPPDLAFLRVPAHGIYGIQIKLDWLLSKSGKYQLSAVYDPPSHFYVVPPSEAKVWNMKITSEPIDVSLD